MYVYTDTQKHACACVCKCVFYGMTRLLKPSYKSIRTTLFKRLSYQVSCLAFCCCAECHELKEERVLCIPTAYWLVPHGCSACMLIPPRTTCPGLAPLTVGWGLPHQLLIQKMSHRLQANLTKAFFFSAEGPFSQMTLACVKLTKNVTSAPVISQLTAPTSDQSSHGLQHPPVTNNLMVHSTHSCP